MGKREGRKTKKVALTYIHSYLVKWITRRKLLSLALYDDLEN